MSIRGRFIRSLCFSFQFFGLFLGLCILSLYGGRAQASCLEDCLVELRKLISSGSSAEPTVSEDRSRELCEAGCQSAGSKTGQEVAKSLVEEEFKSLVSKITERGGPVAVSVAREPCDGGGVQPECKSAVAAGRAVDPAAPDMEARRTEIERIEFILAEIDHKYREKGREPSDNCKAAELVDFVFRYRAQLRPNVYYVRGAMETDPAPVGAAIPCNLKLLPDPAPNGRLIVYPQNGGFASGSYKQMDFAFDYHSGDLVAALKVTVDPLKYKGTTPTLTPTANLQREIELTNKASRLGVSKRFLEENVDQSSLGPPKEIPLQKKNRLKFKYLTQELYRGRTLNDEIERLHPPRRSFVLPSDDGPFK